MLIARLNQYQTRISYICGKGLYNIFGIVWRVDIFGAIEEWFGEFQLRIYVLGDEKVDPATKVLDPADCVDDAGGGGDKDE